MLEMLCQTAEQNVDAVVVYRQLEWKKSLPPGRVKVLGAVHDRSGEAISKAPRLDELGDCLNNAHKRELFRCPLSGWAG